MNCPLCGSNSVESDYDPDQGPFWECQDCFHCWPRAAQKAADVEMPDEQHYELEDR